LPRDEGPVGCPHQLRGGHPPGRPVEGMTGGPPPRGCLLWWGKGLRVGGGAGGPAGGTPTPIKKKQKKNKKQKGFQAELGISVKIGGDLGGGELAFFHRGGKKGPVLPTAKKIPPPLPGGGPPGGPLGPLGGGGEPPQTRAGGEYDSGGPAPKRAQSPPPPTQTGGGFLASGWERELKRGGGGGQNWDGSHPPEAGNGGQGRGGPGFSLDFSLGRIKPFPPRLVGPGRHPNPQAPPPQTPPQGGIVMPRPGGRPPVYPTPHI